MDKDLDKKSLVGGADAEVPEGYFAANAYYISRAYVQLCKREGYGIPACMVCGCDAAAAAHDPLLELPLCLECAGAVIAITSRAMQDYGLEGPTAVARAMECVRDGVRNSRKPTSEAIAELMEGLFFYRTNKYMQLES